LSYIVRNTIVLGTVLLLIFGIGGYLTFISFPKKIKNNEREIRRIETDLQNTPDLANKFKDKGVVFLAINSTGHQEAAKNKEFAEQFKVSHPILDDSKGVVGREYGAQTTPHTFIVDTKGNIVYSGSFDNAPVGKIPEGAQYVNYIDKALGELTASKAVTTAETKPYGCSVKYGK